MVLTREPSSQTVAISFYGLLLALMFFIFQAPDVALSALVVSGIAYPLVLVGAIARVRALEKRRRS